MARVNRPSRHKYQWSHAHRGTCSSGRYSREKTRSVRGLHEGIVNFLRHHDDAHAEWWHGQAFGKRHNVGVTPVITAKGRAETPEAGDHFRRK